MDNNQARIIGIDPGLNKTGWGIIDKQANMYKYIACGTIITAPKLPLAERLSLLYAGLMPVIDKYTPNSVAIEETFVNKNAQSSLKLAHARGALILTLSLANLPISQYSATKVKKSIVGRGHADKEQVKMMVKTLLPRAEIGGFDEADALAVAICHANHIDINKLTGA